MFGRKQTTLVILLVGLLSLTLLAIHLQTSETFPSTDGNIPLPRLGGGQQGGAVFFPVTITPDDWVGAVRLLLGLMTIFSFYIMWRYPKLRKLFAYYAAVILLIYFYIGPKLATMLEEMQEFTVEETTGEAVRTPPMELDEGESTPPEPIEQPEWFSMAAAVIPALIIVAILRWMLQNYFSRETTVPLAAEIGQSAEEAIFEIQQGHDLRSAIIRAYMQMTESVQRNRGIVRKRAVTAGEFITVLQNAGLPSSPVERLTRLFEQVRYSPIAPGMRDQLEAVSCLGEIVSAVERIKEGG